MLLNIFSPINLQNGRQHILYLLEIADFSHGPGKNLFSRLSLVNTIYELYSCTLIGENNERISKERVWIKD